MDYFSMRDDFEAVYAKEFEITRGYPISLEEMWAMRDGDRYDISDLYLNGCWQGYKLAKLGHSPKVEQTAPEPVLVPPPPINWGIRLMAEGKPYPKSSCSACGPLSPQWKGCNSKLLANGITVDD